MSNLNFTLGIVHNTQLISPSFIEKFHTLEIKNPKLDIPFKNDYLYHSNYAVSLDDVESELKKDLKKLNFLKIRRFSFDVGPCYKTVETKNYKYYPGKTLIKKDDLISRTGEEISKLNKLFSFETNLAIENLNYYNTGAYEEEVCLPEFYNEISERYSVEQVLDLAHLKVTAINLGIPYEDLLSRINHKYVKEIHLTKIKILDKNTAIDAHDAPDEIEFKDLLYAISLNPNNDIDIVIEAWKDTEKLISSFNKLYYFLNNNSDHQVKF
tara:strand:+ start:1482 stop:2285 length:804 start_codon:yes stop_codon:yes gene_type:complete